MESLRKNKVFLIDTLSTDASIILNFAQQENILTRREYNNLNHLNHTREYIVTNLLDKVMNKGNETCLRFENLLQCQDLQENFPQLRKLFLPPSLPLDTAAVEEASEYKMTDKRGLCVIINNVDFVPPRQGSNADEDSLKEVFEWLGFTVRAYKNQTAAQMRDVLKSLSQEEHAGGCFVCCILSHGSIDGVLGIDGGTVSKDDIFRPFCGTSCQGLIDKPKVFFIQACRGKQFQKPVQVQADSLAEMKEEADLYTDAVQVISIPADADFLVVRSTVKGYYSLRDIVSGSWFIHALCSQLRAHCPKGEDINYILLRVNEEVSQKGGKQMPVYKVTLRKKLVFRVPRMTKS
ncbi:caspase-8-like [Trichomycterus rosablanca]|uniref:caspase-8-like n=1 Tax=Trichomycterus rosablanca TaxID=2290929 RepID=UPI002F3582E3